jgi:hypothetical protein
VLTPDVARGGQEEQRDAERSMRHLAHSRCSRPRGTAVKGSIGTGWGIRSGRHQLLSVADRSARNDPAE